MSVLSNSICSVSSSVSTSASVSSSVSVSFSVSVCISASDISDSDTSDSCTLSVVSAASSVTGSFCAPNTVPHGITDVAATVAVNVIAIILVSFLFFIIILLLFFLGANPPCNLIFIKKYNDARNNSPFFKMVSFFYFLFRKKHPKIQI